MKGDIIDPITLYAMMFGALALVAVALVIDYGFNALVLFLAFRYLKAKITTEKLLKGCIVATAAGAIADLLANVAALSVETAVPLKFLLYGAIAFAGIFAANYLLAKKYYRTKKGKAQKVGIIMGILTNPVWLMAALMLLGA
jgi:multisubunit Na+/H+ antiporter MnhE subunit